MEGSAEFNKLDYLIKKKRRMVGQATTETQRMMGMETLEDWKGTGICGEPTGKSTTRTASRT